MADFSRFGNAVSQRYQQLAKHELFVTIDGHALWDQYLAAFPEGSNPIFRERTEHDCSCCKNFIRNLGNLVSIENGEIRTVWDVKDLDEPYATVAAKLAEAVRGAAITGIFRTKFDRYGSESSVEDLGDGKVRRWHHFCGKVASPHLVAQPDEARGITNTVAEVFKRGLTELKLSAIDDVIGLVKANNLYRGEEHLPAVQGFRKLKVSYDKAADKSTFVWANVNDRASRFRNTVIGTLVQDLSNDEDLEASVRSFESKVAPMNYKRPTALITPGMVKQAMETIKELDLEDALQRRLARLDDVSVNNVLWVDSSVRSRMKNGGIENLLMSAATTAAPAKDKAEDISAAEFMERILPKSTGLEVYVKNPLAPNFMTLTAPVHEGSANDLFKWSNGFAWSYVGNITDSIKERVKKAGGNVTDAKLRVSLAWHNYDDLDIHAQTPDGHHIYFMNKAGVLDVDMNAGRGTTREPVENLSWRTLRDGRYEISVNQYSARETSNVGFEIEVESQGQLQQFSYKKATRTGTYVPVMFITIEAGRIVDMKLGKGIEGGTASKELWGVSTESYVKVQTVMQSPNHWDGQSVGNRHWFFFLEGCRTDEPMRGIYNEFLNPRLDKHRKVFETLGEKTKCEPAEEQLSGIGFSSTKNDSVLVRVKTNKGQRLYNLQF